MNRLMSMLLKKYDTNDQELVLKAKFLLTITSVVILGLILTIIYTCYTFGFRSPTVLTESVGLAVMLAALIFLLNGSYVLAVHLIFITSFSVAWVLMFTEPVTSILIKLDTIVFIIGLMSALPLMFFKTRRPMVLYFLFNYGIFIYFNFYLAGAVNLTTREQVDYALDNSIAMFFVFVVSFILFTINQQVLNSLKRLRLFLSSIINSMPSAIIGINDNYEIVMWNVEASKITGVTQINASQHNLFDVLPQLQLFQEKIRSVILANTMSKEHKVPFLCQGQLRIIDLAVYPLSHDDTGGAVIRIDDISERLQMEEALVQSEKMLSVGGLAAGMAHELNNPLAGMIQSAQVIHNRLTRNVPANDKAAADLGFTMKEIQAFMDNRGILKQLENIKDAGNRAAQIVKNMLSFARKSDREKEEINLIELIDATIDLAESDYDFKKKSDFKNIEIIKNYNPGDSPILRCEKIKIQQVLFNILKNASEAISMDDDRKPQPRIVINLFEDSDFVCIEIEDNGPGMDEETRKRVFEPFFTTKPVDQGTGLGLSVSYFIIVEDHRGKMTVESAPGNGAKFIICLPRIVL